MFDIDSIVASGGAVTPNSVFYAKGSAAGPMGPTGQAGAPGTPGWNHLNLNNDVELSGVGFRTLISNNTTPAVYASAASLLNE